MNKELTAMQILIEELSQRKESNAVRMVIAMIKANYLQKEQEQIEKAYEKGYTEALRIHDVIGSCGFYEQDNTTAMNCKHCGKSKWIHGNVNLL